MNILPILNVLDGGFKMKNPKEIVIGYWNAMNTNDFAKAAEYLSVDFKCFWQQSNEVIIGRENFIALNTAYPSDGLWQFTINHLIADGSEVCTDVTVTDGTTNAQAITFHTVKDGLICKQVEYWVDSYDAPKWRQQWVEKINNNE